MLFSLVLVSFSGWVIKNAAFPRLFWRWSFRRNLHYWEKAACDVDILPHYRMALPPIVRCRLDHLMSYGNIPDALFVTSVMLFFHTYFELLRKVSNFLSISKILDPPDLFFLTHFFNILCLFYLLMCLSGVPPVGAPRFRGPLSMTLRARGSLPILHLRYSDPLHHASLMPSRHIYAGIVAKNPG